MREHVPGMFLIFIQQSRSITHLHFCMGYFFLVSRFLSADMNIKGFEFVFLTGGTSKNARKMNRILTD